MSRRRESPKSKIKATYLDYFHRPSLLQKSYNVSDQSMRVDLPMGPQVHLEVGIKPISEKSTDDNLFRTLLVMQLISLINIPNYENSSHAYF